MKTEKILWINFDLMIYLKDYLLSNVIDAYMPIKDKTHKSCYLKN